MNETTQKQLLDKYSHLFAGEGTPFGAWGFETHDGWNDLVANLLAELDKYGKENKVEIKILQLKTKLSSIRCYVSALPETNFDSVFRIIDKYEEISKVTCEECGQAGKVKNFNGWLKTVCPEHSKNPKSNTLN